MGDQQQFCLRWNNHHINMLHVFGNLLSNEALVDVTLACEGSSIRAHKIVLSACSPFFQDVFLNNPCKHPVVVLKDMKFVELKTILEFMYKGEVNVSQDKLPSLLKSAENLKVKGLAEVTSEQQKNEKSDMHHSTVIEGVSSQCAGLVQSANNNETVSNSSRRKRKRKRSGSMLKEIYKQEMEDIIDIPDDEQISPLQHSGYDHPTISCDVNDVHQTSSVNDTHNTHSSSCNQASEDLDTQILEPHEIKEAPRSPPITAQNDDTQVDNPEYVLDPANFMEQSLSTCQEYLPSPTTKSRIKVDTSSPIVISTAGGDTSLNCTPNDSFTQGRSNSQCGHSDLSPGIGLQYDSTVSNNNSGLMVYMEPGTSGSCSASEASSSLSPSKGPPDSSANVFSGRSGDPSGRYVDRRISERRASSANSDSLRFQKSTRSSEDRNQTFPSISKCLNTCHICNYTFHNRSNYNKHMRQGHSDVSILYTCCHCNKDFKWQSNMINHRKQCPFKPRDEAIQQ